MSPIALLHVVTGTVAVLAGGAALFSKKGGKFHRKAGKIFTVTMICMAVSGAVMGYVINQFINVIAGVFTIYLVVSSWHAVQHKLLRLRSCYVGFLIVSLLVTAGSSYAGMTALASEGGSYQGYPAFAYFFFAGLAAISCITDATMIFRGDVQHKHRVARHLWRMCLAYFIAAGSLFTGPGAKAFPDFIQSSGVLSIPEPLILLLMLFWLGKTLLKKAPAKQNI